MSLSERTEATQTAVPNDENPSTGRTARWGLQLSYHPQGLRLGTRVALDPGCLPLTLGRKADIFGEDVLRDEHMSRNHATLEARTDGLRIRDEGSHNGTFVNGRRIETELLSPGDVLGVGRMLLLVTREPQAAEVSLPDGVVGQSFAFCKAVASATRSGVRFPLVLLGPAGAGKDTLARLVHGASRPASEFVRWSCGSREPLQDALRGFSAETTLYLDNIDQLSADEQIALAVALETPDGGPSIIASTIFQKAALLSRLDPHLAHRLFRWEVSVPPLAERISDITELAVAAARRFSGNAEAGLSAELMFRLLRHSWPGNLHEFEAVLERAAVESDGPVLDVFEDLDAILASTANAANARMISTFGRVVSTQPFRVDPLGRWYEMPDGTRHNIERRKTLSRLLATFVEARAASPGQPLSVADLLERAWSEERLLPRSGANRVYVAVTTLRKMGLKNLLVRVDGGYVLDPDVPLEIVDDELKTS